MTDTTTTPTGGKTQNPRQACSVCGSTAHPTGYHDNSEPTGYHDNSSPAGYHDNTAPAGAGE